MYFFSQSVLLKAITLLQSYLKDVVKVESSILCIKVDVNSGVVGSTLA